MNPVENPTERYLEIKGLPNDLRAEIAKTLGEKSFRSWVMAYDYCVREGDGVEEAIRHADYFHANEVRNVFFTVDQVIGVMAKKAEAVRSELELRLKFAVGGNADVIKFSQEDLKEVLGVIPSVPL